MILLLPVLVIGVAMWPGHMNADSLTETNSIARGEFTRQFAPLLEMIWKPFWELGIRPGWVLLLQVVVFVIGSYLVLRSAFRPIGAAVAVALVALSPPVLGNLGTVMRDTWFIALLLLTFGLLVRASQRQWPVRGRYLALAIAAAWLTLATRQNGAAAALIACIAIAGLWLAHWRELARPTGRVRIMYGPVGALAGGIALVLALLATQAAATAALGVQNIHSPEANIEIYDLAAISHRTRENMFPSDVLAKRGISTVDLLYNRDAIDNFLFTPHHPIAYPLDDARADSLRSAWWDAVRGHPGEYLAARWSLFMRQLAVTRRSRLVYHTGIDSNLHGFAIAHPSLNGVVDDYIGAFADRDWNGDPIFTTWFYLSLALLGTIFLLLPGTPVTLRVVGGLSLSALTYQVGLFFAAMGLQFHWEYPCVVIGMLAGLVLLRLAWQERPTRSAPARQL
jgi:hypothetical protein